MRGGGCMRRERETLQQNNRPPMAPNLPCVAHLFKFSTLSLVWDRVSRNSWLRWADDAELPILLSLPPVQDYSCTTRPGYSFKSSLELSQPPDYPESVLPVFRGCLIILSVTSSRACPAPQENCPSLLYFLSYHSEPETKMLEDKDHTLVTSTVSKSRITHHVLNKHLVKGKESN